MSREARLVAENLIHRYSKGRPALDRVSFRASDGIIGLLGPNGAGKTTLLRVLAAILRPTSGLLWWDGCDVLKDPAPLRRALGYLPQRFAAPSHCTGREVVRSAGSMRGLSSRGLGELVEQAIAAAHLEDVADQRVGTYSGGMVRRLGIAQALVHQPRVLLVDEPTAGLDPEERIHFRSLIHRIARDRIIMISTHIVSDIESLAHRVMVLASGTIVVDDALPNILKSVERRVWQARGNPNELLEIQRMPGVVPIASLEDADHVTVRFYADAATFPFPVAPVTPSLEDAYVTALAATKRGT